jgi:hypothetical protein
MKTTALAFYATTFLVIACVPAGAQHEAGQFLGALNIEMPACAE